MGQDLSPAEEAQHAEFAQAAKLKELVLWKKVDVFHPGRQRNFFEADCADAMGNQDPHLREDFLDTSGARQPSVISTSGDIVACHRELELMEFGKEERVFCTGGRIRRGRFSSGTC